MRRVSFFIVCCAALACAGQPARSQTSADVHRILGDVIPRIEKTVGLTFKSPPNVAVRTRQQVRAYLQDKLAHDLPPATLEHVETAYRLFGLIPDTLDLRKLLVALYTEQVAGYYDPDSTTLYVIDGTDPAQLRLVLGHELVHALQGQYVPLDSLLSQEHDDDRRTAAQAVMEGQATLASLAAMVSDSMLAALPKDFTDLAREQIQQSQSQMPVFSSAPRVVKESMLFPYLAGADFMRWFDQTYPDTVPFGARLPVSTEQIMHPERYRHGDEPVTLRFPSATWYDDDLGEFGSRMLLTQLSGSETLGSAGALGWGGDRYGIFAADSAKALVWWSVWDTPRAADRFADLLRKQWPHRQDAAGRRWTVTRQDIDGHAGVRLVDAPAMWAGWRNIPSVRVATTPAAPPSGKE